MPSHQKQAQVGKPSGLHWSPDNSFVAVTPHSTFVVPLDDQVLTEPQAAEFCGMSKDTLRRRVNAGDGPKRLRLSAKRIGYRVKDLRTWQDANVEEVRP
jgi:predicted DNA-binding transcriptional regulator AlpA